MRFARKLTLLATMAFTATAVAVPAAFAQDTEPELHNQTPRLLVQQEIHNAADILCPTVIPTPPVAQSPTVTQGGCRAHVASVGNVAIAAHAPGGAEAVILDCSLEFDVRIDSAGEGWMTHQEMGPVATGCFRRPCGQVTPPTSEGRAWSFHMSEVEPPGGTERIVFLLCTEDMNDGGFIWHCEFTLPISQPTVHDYRFVGNDVPGHAAPLEGWPSCEFTGTLDVEAAGVVNGEGQTSQELEIRHT